MIRQNVQFVRWCSEVCTYVCLFSCRKQSSPTCPLTPSTCSECRQCVSATCAVISVKLCCSEVTCQKPFWLLAVLFLFFSSRNNAEISLMSCFFCLSANTTRIFEGSRIVKTGMVSGSEEEQICLCVMCLCEITINNFCMSLLFFSLQFLQHLQQIWLP